MTRRKDMTTAERLVGALAEKGLTCATAESCTGGGVGFAITAVAGSSAVFWGGVVSYDNSVKRGVLGVPEEVLATKGAVSSECAAAKRLIANRAVACIQTWGTPAEAAGWADKVESLARDKGELGSFEFVVWCAVRRRLRRRPPSPYRRPDALTHEAAAVVATIASFGANQQSAYALARKRLRQIFPRFPETASPCSSVRAFADAMDSLRALSGPAKNELLTGLRDVVAEDGEITDEESDYLSAVADAIGAPAWR